MRLDYDTSRKTVMEYLVPRAVYRPPPALPAFIQQQGPPGRHASPPYFSESSSLLIRHLPEDYSYGEAADFLGGLGAKTVKYFGATGRLVRTAGHCKNQFFSVFFCFFFFFFLFFFCFFL
jgi:hypothetical protein